MAPERNISATEEGEVLREENRERHKNPKRRDDYSSEDESSDSEDEKNRSRKKERSSKRRRRSRSSKRRSRISESDEEDSSSSGSYSESDSVDSDGSDSASEESKEEVRKRTKERKREKEHERDSRKRKERKEKEMRRKRRKEKEEKERKRKEKKKKKRKKEKSTGKMGAVTNSWGKYGIIRETDMWNKRPEFTAWLAEVKQVNLESLPNWEEKQMFKDFMEDHNTATFPSTKYYNLDAYHQKKMVKAMKKGLKRAMPEERVVFNDEEQRRLELQIERERQKEEQVVALKRSMQTGMAQAMKEQAQLREEMAYQYKLGNFEAAAAIQRRLDPDVAM